MRPMRFERSLPADVSVLPPLRRHLSGFLAAAGVATPIVNDVALVATELVANAIAQASGTVTVEAVVDAGSAEVVVTNPPSGAELGPPDTWRVSDVGQDRGRGLAIIRALTPEITVRSDGSGTVVRCRWPSVDHEDAIESRELEQPPDGR